MSFIVADNIISSIGLSTKEVLENVEKKVTGITNTEQYSGVTEAPISLINKEQFLAESNLGSNVEYTFFEKLCISSVSEAISTTDIDFTRPDTLLILSTTKGNIELIHSDNITDGLVASAAKKIGGYFNCVNRPVVVCNACISGVLALIVADRYIRANKFGNIVVVGADIVTDFVVAGFESFKSMSPIPCKPFDAERIGLSLGEGAGTIVLSASPLETKQNIRIVSGSSANDANHISGPSRTGEGAFLASSRALKGNKNIDFISAHGTATPYNDDMESIALSRLHLENVPVNSFKGYFGHTLGAAGVIESILTIHSMKQNRLFATLGLENQGVASKINTFTQHSDKELNRCLKIASGFGGCNAAAVFEKDE